MDDPFRVFDEIRLAYQRYLDSPFRLRYDALREERRSLLFRDGQLFREPLIEPIPPYETSGLTVAGACTQLGIPNEAADFITRGLFRSGVPLHQHQFDAWQHSRAGRAVVVTTGTGSGKTECYLLPIFAYLVEDLMRGWGNPNPIPARHLWWRYPHQGRILQRGHEPQARTRAVRALMLYPLNALIEDQLSRIRKACDNNDARGWFSGPFVGHRFWFGRYNAVAPVSGPKESQNKRSELRRRIQGMDRDWGRAQASAAARRARASSSEEVNRADDILNYFQNPEGSEMWSRWDMQSDPPDILITNYSMLNIMLMRSLEEGIFEETKNWLEADRENNFFHLVVDELHSYRGTPGTEVGYLLRALLQRIGLAPDSPQLRIIATSASIENNSQSREYLEQFFGRDGSSFEILAGRQTSFDAPPEGLSPYSTAFAVLDHELTTTSVQIAAANFATAVGSTSGGDPGGDLSRAYEHISALEPVRLAGSQEPFTLERLSHVLFVGASETEQAAARGLIRGLIHARIPGAEPGTTRAPLPLRVHYFFHNAGRIWACTNPDCSGRTGATPEGAPRPPVGRLFTDPIPRCDSCGARVLELLYCQPCGEVFLGGYKKLDANSSNAWFLSPDYPNLDQVPSWTLPESFAARGESGVVLVWVSRSARCCGQPGRE